MIDLADPGPQHPPTGGPPDLALLIVSNDIESPNDLPWDVEHEATAVVRVRWPVPAVDPAALPRS